MFPHLLRTSRSPYHACRKGKNFTSAYNLLLFVPGWSSSGEYRRQWLDVTISIVLFCLWIMMGSTADSYFVVSYLCCTALLRTRLIIGESSKGSKRVGDTPICESDLGIWSNMASHSLPSMLMLERKMLSSLCWWRVEDSTASPFQESDISSGPWAWVNDLAASAASTEYSLLVPLIHNSFRVTSRSDWRHRFPEFVGMVIRTVSYSSQTPKRYFPESVNVISCSGLGYSSWREWLWQSCSFCDDCENCHQYVFSSAITIRPVSMGWNKMGFLTPPSCGNGPRSAILYHLSERASCGPFE